MKSAIYNEVALVLLASKLTGPAGQMDEHPFGGLSRRRPGARQRHRGRAGARPRRPFSRPSGSRTIAAVGAYPQAGSNAFVANLGTLAGVYRTPAVHADVTAVYTNTNPMRRLSRQRPARGGLCHRADGRRRRRRARHRPDELRRRNMIPPEAMPFKSGLTFTYDCGEFEKSLDMALDLADFAGFEARRAEARAPRQIARLRHLEHDRARRGGRL